MTQVETKTFANSQNLFNCSSDHVVVVLNGTLTSARLVCDWKNTDSLWLHFGHGWSSVRGSVGSATTSPMIWVSSLSRRNIWCTTCTDIKNHFMFSQIQFTRKFTDDHQLYLLHFMLDFVHVNARIVGFLLVIAITALQLLKKIIHVHIFTMTVIS